MIYATYRDHCRTRYSRAIENQLVLAHLPFAHHMAIVLGGRALVHGPVVQWADVDEIHA